MKKLTLPLALTACLWVSGCDVQSGITKKSIEDYQPTPTPEKIVPVVEEIDPADVITADTSTSGPTIFVNEDAEKKKISCSKYNRVMINGTGNEITITGVCSQIMVNGHRNQVKAIAATELKLFGSQNTLEYTKYVNGKKPLVTDSSGTNIISKSEKP